MCRLLLALRWIGIWGLVTPAFSQVYNSPYVSANARVLASFAGEDQINPLVVQTYDTGEVSVASLSAATSATASLSLNETRTGVFGTNYSVLNTAFFQAQPGLLRANSQSLVSMDASYSGGSVNSESSDWTLAATIPGATFVDTITILGVPDGTPVLLTITARLDGTATDTGADSGSSSSGVVAYGNLNVASTAGGAVNITKNSQDGLSEPFSLTDSFQTTVIAGTPFQIQATLTALADAFRSTHSGSSQSGFSAMNTGYVSISTSEESAVISSHSGYGYHIIPEPGFLSFFGLLILATFLKRSGQSCCR